MFHQRRIPHLLTVKYHIGEKQKKSNWLLRREEKGKIQIKERCTENTI